MKFRLFACFIFLLFIMLQIISSVYMLQPYNIPSVFSLINIRKEILSVSGILLFTGFAVSLMRSGKKEIKVRMRHVWLCTAILYIMGNWFFININHGMDKINSGMYIIAFVTIYYSIRSLYGKPLFIILGTLYTLYIFYIIIALLQVTGFFPVIKPYAFTATFENPGDAANFIAAIIPLNLALIFHQCSKPRGILIASLVLGIILLVLSNARIAWLATALSLISFLAIYFSAFVKTLSRKLKRGVIIAGMCVFLLSVCGLLSFKTNSTKGRLLIYNVCFTMIREHPGTGIGIGRFKIDYNNAQAIYLKKQPVLGIYADNTYAAFNEYLQVLVEQGIIGGMLMILFIVSLFWSVRHMILNNNDDNDRDRAIYTGCISSLVAISVCALASYPFQNAIIAYIAIMNISLLIKRGNPAGSPLTTVQLNRGLLVTLSLLLITISIYMTQVKTQELLACFKWAKAVTLVKNNQTAEATAKYKTIVDDLAGCGGFLYNYGAQSALNGNFAESQKLLLTSTLYYTHSDQYAFIGDNYVELGQYKEAEMNYLHAIYMVPSRVYPKYKLVKLYLKTNRIPEALLMAKVIIETPLKGTNYIAFEIKKEMEALLSKHP